MQCKGNGTKAVSSVLTSQEVESLPLHPTQEIEMAPIDEAVSDLKLALAVLEESDKAEKDRSYDNVIKELNAIRHLADELYGEH
jgi:hypothetical protein